MVTLQQPWTHLSPVTHIYASVNRASIGLDNGLSPIWRQAIIQTNAEILSIEPLETHFNEVLIKIQKFSFMKMTAILSRGRGVNCISSLRLVRPLRQTASRWFASCGLIHYEAGQTRWRGCYEDALRSYCPPNYGKYLSLLIAQADSHILTPRTLF